MMKAPTRMAIAVRRTDGRIEVRKENISSIKDQYPVLKLPILRGIVTFGETMVLGVKSLMASAEMYGEVEAMEEYKPSKFEQFIADKTGKKIEDVVLFFALVLALAFAVLLFVILPVFSVSLLRPLVKKDLLLSLIEGCVRLCIFMLYLVLVSRLKDIRRVFEYHGAEHKTIHCYEHGEELSVENVRKYSTLHPRCGTAFLLIVMVVSILAFSVLSWDNILVRVLSKLVLLPLVAGISYEVTRWAGNADARIVRVVLFPGLMLQKLTTREPDDGQLEVAIRSFLAAMGEDKTKEEDKKDESDRDLAAGSEDAAGGGNPGSQAGSRDADGISAAVSKA